MILAEDGGDGQAWLPHGGAGDGVLGFTTDADDVYFVRGWGYFPPRRTGGRPVALTHHQPYA